MKTYESLIDGLDDLKKRGFVEDFAIEPTCLYCGALNIRLQPSEFNIEETYRFEGDSNPDDNMILYAISSSMGIKGTLVDGYGVYAENVSFEMAHKLHDKESSGR